MSIAHTTRSVLAVLTIALIASCGRPPVVPAPAESYTFATPQEPEARHSADARREYVGPDGRSYTYRVQEPESLPDNAPIVVFAHGAQGNEDLGMGLDYAQGTFVNLRNVLEVKGWLYVTIGDYEWDGLRDELIERYGEREVYLIGTSAGGAAVLREAVAHPERYAGLILCCPALPRLAGAEKLTMPMVLSVGTEDVHIAAFCRGFAADVAAVNDRLLYFEIPGGGHGDPLTRADWAAQIDWVAE